MLISFIRMRKISVLILFVAWLCNVNATSSSSPTAAPTSAQLTSHTVRLAFQVTGLTTAIATAKSEIIKSLLAVKVGVAIEAVGIVSVTRRRLEESQNPEAQTSIWISPMSALIERMPQLLRRLDPAATTQVRISGFTFSTEADSALAALVTYLQSSSAAGFVSELNAGATLSLTGVATVTEQTSADPGLDTILAGYPSSCIISQKTYDTLYWKVDPSMQYVSVLYLHKGKSTTSNDWVSIGLVDESEDMMVGSNTEIRVFVYKPNIDKHSTDFYYKMIGYKATDLLLTPDPARTALHQGVTFVQSVNDYVVMAFDYNVNTGVKSDCPLRLGPGMSNKVIWASTIGESWPAKHKGDGFNVINWSDGTCGAPPFRLDIPYWAGAFFLVAVVLFNGHISPLRACAHSFSCFNPLKRLHPTVLSRYLGNSISRVFLLDEKQVAHYTAPGVSLSVLYLLFNVLVLVLSSATSFVLMSGRMAVLNMWLTLIPASKTSVVLHLTGVPFERLMKFHKMTAFIGFAFTVAHYFSFVNRILNVDKLSDPVGALYDFTSYGVGVYPGYGMLGFLCYIPMSLLAIRIIREVKYKIFYAVHQLWIVAVIFTMLHFPLGSVNQLGFLPGLVLQIADRLDLLCTPTIAAEGSTISTAKTSESSALVSTADVFSLRVFTKQTNSWLSETMLYQKIASLFAMIFRDANEGLGQYYFINAPAISIVEWHPFSVSQMNEQSMTFHIKTCKPGSWTCKLLTYIQDSTARSPNGQVEVKLRGPYGSLSINLAEYSHIILIAGGIGITPMLPILYSIRSQQKKYPCLRKVTIVWAARKENESLFCEFADQITDFVDISGSQSASSNMESREVVGAEAGDGDLELTVLGQAEVEMSQRKQRSVGPSLYAGVHSSVSISVEVEYYLTGEKESNRDAHEFTSSSGSDNKHTCVYGRPNFKSLAKNAVKQAEQPQLATGRNAVCAFVCGPAAMSTDAAVACADNGIDYHLETFGW